MKLFICSSSSRTRRPFPDKNTYHVIFSSPASFTVLTPCFLIHKYNPTSPSVAPPIPTIQGLSTQIPLVPRHLLPIIPINQDLKTLAKPYISSGLRIGLKLERISVPTRNRLAKLTLINRPTRGNPRRHAPYQLRAVALFALI